MQCVLFLFFWIVGFCLCGNSETTQSLELERKQIWSCWDAQSHCFLSNFETYPLRPCSVVCSWEYAHLCISHHESLTETIPWGKQSMTILRFGHSLGIVFLRCFWYDFWSPNISKSMGTVRYSKICPCWLMMLFRSAPCIYRASDPETNDAYPANKLISAGIVKAFTHLWQKRNSPMPFTKAWSFHKTVTLPLIHYWPIHLPFGYSCRYSRACWIHFGMGKYWNIFYIYIYST